MVSFSPSPLLWLLPAAVVVTFGARMVRRRAPKTDDVELFEAMQALFNADSWMAGRRIVKHNPILLSQEAEAFLEERVLYLRKQGPSASLNTHVARLHLLKRCRVVGVDAAFEEGQLAALSGSSPSFLAFLNELQPLEAAGHHREIVALCERAFDTIEENSERAIVLGQLATALVEIKPLNLENEERALRHIEHALELDKHAPTGIRPAMLRLQGTLRARKAEVSKNDAAEIDFVALLESYDAHQQPVERARAAHNLMMFIRRHANVDSDMPDEKGIEKMVKLGEHVRSLLRRPELEPFLWSSTLSLLSLLYGSRQLGDKKENMKRSARVAEEALQACSAQQYPYPCAIAAWSLGAYRLHELSDPRAAFESYQVSSSALDVLIADQFDPHARQYIHELRIGTYAGLLKCALSLKDEPYFARQLLLLSDAARGRDFRDQVSVQDIAGPASVDAGLAQRERALRTELSSIAARLLAGDLDPTLAERQDYAKRELCTVWDEMVRSDPTAEEYVAIRRGDPISWEDCESIADQLGPHAAFVELVGIDNCHYAVILREGWSVPKIVALGDSEEAFVSCYWPSFRQDILERRLDVEYRHEWLDLGEILLTPLLPYLDGVEVLVLVPHGALHHLPLHAMSCGGRPLIERFATVYSPSAAVLLRLLRRGRGRGTGRPLVMGFTDRPEERASFYGEAQQIADSLGTTPVLGTDATSACLHSGMQTAPIVHLVCHGNFAADPLDAAVYLADGPVTARQWMTWTNRADLVTLSACETGAARITNTDDPEGLSRALLAAGCSTALLTFWSVYSEPTRQWMVDFYQLLSKDGGAQPHSVARAAREATLRARIDHPDPYVWAAFKLIGHPG